MTKKCSYCQVENNVEKEQCEFCEAPLNIERPSLDNEVVEEDFTQPYPVLIKYHTYHLLLLLKRAREERTKVYKLMQTVRKAPQEASVSEQVVSYSEESYRAYTARVRLIEAILIDRMGYKPKRVDDKLLISLFNKIQGESSR
ncbi:hypothetical protein [Halobacillus litoralis]|uniref:hypothetical protein n=1 Tax=Halobacillus litoralis TaxID=45668 RepID=UPI001CD39C82|nr:hypothetical protein [Halobacillus litoralis]MCA1024445.1 hypothetical protein [Halobacillus litoralis]